MNLTTIRTDIANVLAGVSTVRYAYAQPPDTVAGTPACVVLDPRLLRSDPGPGLRRLYFDVPVWLLIARTADEARTSQAKDALFDPVVTAFESLSGQSYSLNGNVTFIYVRAATPGLHVVGKTQYSTYDFVLSFSVRQAAYQS